MDGDDRSADVPEVALRGSMRDFRALRAPDLLARCAEFYDWQCARRASGTWPFSRSTDRGPRTSCAVRDDQGVLAHGVNFASQDYLSLSQHPAVLEAAKAAVDLMGVHSAGSPALLGNTAASLALERRLAQTLQAAEVVLFPTGWAAGYGVIKGLVRSWDYVVIDALAHACLQEGAKAATRNVVPFRHLDVDHCRDRLSAIRTRDPAAGVLLVTESLFSMDSDTPDLAAMQSLAREFGATLVVDVAHDLGALGPRGTGHLGRQNMLGQVDLVMGSFSKTFASNGGFVATNRRAVKEYLRFYSPSCTFSNALSPAQVGAVSVALDIASSAEGDCLRDSLMRNVLLLRELVCASGLEVYGAPSPIVAVRTGEEAVARLMARELPGLGLMANLVEFPAVAKGQARFRLQVMASHTAADVEQAVTCLIAAQRAASDTMRNMPQGAKRAPAAGT